MPREFELKYRLSPEQLAPLRAKYSPFSVFEMETIYYDTPTGQLGRRHWTFRCRMENGAPVCTLKTPADNGARGEWEVICENIADAPEKLIALGAPEALRDLAAEGVVPICGARFTRLAAPIACNSAILELALDQGVLLNGTHEIPLCELEVELKQGRDADALAFANALAQEYGLIPEPKSKFYRALHAADNL